MRPITLNEEIIDTYLAQIKTQLTTTRVYKGVTFKFDPAKNMTPETRPTINFSAMAYLKMCTLVDMCDTECAWHGIVEANEERTRFDICDILVYPQDVAGATVQTDEVKYTAWKNELSDDEYNNLRLQGHSHVNFTASPSGVDTTLYEHMLSVLNKDSYYIFMIMNKSRKFWFEIHDLKNNVIYETADIDVTVATVNLEEWYKEQRKQFKTTKTNFAGAAWVPKSGVTYGGPQYGSRSYASAFDRKPAQERLIGFDEMPPYEDDDAFYSAIDREAATHMKQAAPEKKRGRGRPRKESK